MFTASRLTNIILALLALAVAGTVAVSLPPSAAAAAQWRLHQLDRDRCWDAATIDADFNGNSEDARFDIDNDCRWDTRLWNSLGGDGFAESLTFDMDENGRWEYWLADNDQREGFDVVYFDDNEDGYYDRWAYLPRAAPSTSLETLRDQLGQGTVVGGAPQRSGAMGLVVFLAGYTRQAAWAPPDSDGDGWPNHMGMIPIDAEDPGLVPQKERCGTRCKWLSRPSRRSSSSVAH